MDRWYLILPLVSGFLYAVAALSQKRVIAAGYGPWRMSALTSLGFGLGFAPLYWFEAEPSLPDPLWHPVCCGTLFFVGQLLTIFSITRGDVSVATPVLGSKVVLVALFLTLFTDEALRWSTWVAALLTSVGIVLLQWDPRKEMRRELMMTVLVALMSACCFAIADVMVQEGSKDIGFYRYISVSSAMNIVLAFALIPMFRGPIWKIPAGTWGHVGMGVGLIVLQAILLAFAIGYFGDAAGANIVYSSRGLWSVLLVWWVGHWFQNIEKDAGREVLISRFIGALLIVAALLMIFI
ncbi:MAG: DMT family transporter [Candidatus Methylacidiphilales bacterium]